MLTTFVALVRIFYTILLANEVIRIRREHTGTQQNSNTYGSLNNSYLGATAFRHEPGLICVNNSFNVPGKFWFL
jgi:hypothetical protein